MTKEQIIEILKTVTHPGKGNRNIVELGMVEDIGLKDNEINIILAFPKHRDPLGEYITGSTKATLIREFKNFTINVSTKIKKEESTKPKTSELTLEELNSVSHIIGIASGKGGVGKSTISVNLAIALAKSGYKVGLTDADVYGPSIPLMTGTEGELPAVINENGKEIIMPIEKYGVKWMSVGYFSPPEQALIWRGPMACSALKQMLLQIRWGQLDYLLIDMPPGTGDIHLSLVQDIPMEGAIIVTTPQQVAIADVKKGIDMFRNPNINRRVFGIVENMSWFTPEELPENKYFIFGKGGGEEMAKQFCVPLIGHIPIVMNIREGGDTGKPAVLSEGKEAEAFMDLASTIANITNHPY